MYAYYINIYTYMPFIFYKVLCKDLSLRTCVKYTNGGSCGGKVRGMESGKEKGEKRRDIAGLLMTMYRRVLLVWLSEPWV